MYLFSNWFVSIKEIFLNERSLKYQKGPCGGFLQQPKHFHPQIQAISKLILRTVEVSNKIHSYPFKNTVKLWAYKNNSEPIYTTSQALLFVVLNIYRYIYKKKFCRL